MMPYIFCLLVDLANYACVAWLGWLVWKGANGFLIFVMLLLPLCMLFPGKSVFTCPECGHAAEASVFQSTAGGERPQAEEREEE